MGETDRRAVLLRRIALASAVLVLTIVGLSAYLRLSGAGLGCADWPQCYGAAWRQLRAGAAPLAPGAGIAAARLAHRVSATAALVLVLAYVMLSLRPAPALRRQARFGFALLALVLFLAVLGRWTPGARVPAVAIGNLLGGFGLFALCWRVAGPESRAAGALEPARAARDARWIGVGIAVLVLEVALGGLASASYTGLSCTGLIDCGPVSAWSWQALDPWREPVFLPGTSINPGGALAQVAHRAGAVLVLALLAPLALRAWRSGARGAGAVVLALLALQVALGVVLATAALPLPAALAHNLTAALLLAAVVALL